MLRRHRGEGGRVEGIILQRMVTLNVGLILVAFEHNHVVEQAFLHIARVSRHQLTHVIF